MAELFKQPEITVLRWGHRFRDQRVTTHVALVARAFGASGIILADVRDEKVKATVERIVENWGGKFDFQMGMPWRNVIKEWRGKRGIVIHLTAYGENIQTSDVMNRIRAAEKPILVIVGSQKVPKEFFFSDVSDFNVAIGNQPHSEISSITIFLDRFYEGKELRIKFDQAKLRIVPQRRGKKVIRS